MNNRYSESDGANFEGGLALRGRFVTVQKLNTFIRQKD